MAEDIYNLQDEITSNFSKSLYVSDHFRDRILGLTSLYPVDVFEKSYKKLIRELNKKLELFDLTSKIIEPVDAGLRPTDLTNFFNQSVIPSGFTIGYSVRALVPGNPKVMRLRFQPNPPYNANDFRYKDFLASEMTFDDIMSFRGGTLGDGALLFVSKWYDQSGNGNHLVAETVSNEPTLALVRPTSSDPGEFQSAVSGVYFNGTTSYFKISFPDRINVKNQPVSSFNVVKLQTPFNLNRHIYGTNTNRGLAALTNRLKYYFTARSIQPTLGTNVDNTSALFSAIHDGTTTAPNVRMSYDGNPFVPVHEHQGSPNVSTHIHTVGRRKNYATASNYFLGAMRELILYTSDKSGDDILIAGNIQDQSGNNIDTTQTFFKTTLVWNTENDVSITLDDGPSNKSYGVLGLAVDSFGDPQYWALKYYNNDAQIIGEWRATYNNETNPTHLLFTAVTGTGTPKVKSLERSAIESNIMNRFNIS